MTSIRDLASRRLTPPPPSGNAALDRWLGEVADLVEATPRFSTFSFETPESNVTASPSTLGFNVASGTTRLWQKLSGEGNTGWVSVVTA